MQILAFLSGISIVWAASLPSTTVLLNKVMKKYAISKAVEMKVEKTLKLALLDKTKVSSGVLTISGKRKFRLEFDKPDKALVVMNEKNLWVVEYPPEGIDDKIRVTTAKVDKKNQAQVFVMSVLGQGKILDNFVIKKTEDNMPSEGQIRFELEPKKPQDDIQKLAVVLDKKIEEIKSVSYWDALENETKLSFNETNLKAKPGKNAFTYVIPKGAEITNF